jgi:hypothetical protein
MESKNIKIITLVALVAVGGMIFAVVSTSNLGMIQNGNASNKEDCLPSDPAVITADYEVKRPQLSAMPASFDLQAIDQPGGVVIMYYADHSLCPFTDSFDGQIDKGAIVVTVSKPEGLAKDSAEFQKKELEYYASQKETIAKVQPFSINGYEGVGWEPFTGKDVVIIKGEVSSETPIKMPGMIRFYNDNDGTLYTITAHQPLETLTAIAKTMTP